MFQRVSGGLNGVPMVFQGVQWNTPISPVSECSTGVQRVEFQERSRGFTVFQGRFRGLSFISHKTLKHLDCGVKCEISLEAL